MPNIWQTEPDMRPLSIEQNVRFQGKICPEKSQLDQIQNGRVEVIIDLNMGNI